MIFLAVIIGLGLPAVIGWLTLHLIEGRHPVLHSIERWLIGFVLGTTLSMYGVFLMHTLLSVPLHRAGFLVMMLTMTAVLSALLFARKTILTAKTIPLQPSAPLDKTQLLICLGAGTWLALKTFSVAFLLIASPPYHDDVINNWNYRGLVFFEKQELTLELEMTNPGINSYPPTVPLTKTWINALYGNWSHALANVAHIFWYVALLGIFYFAMRRFTDVFRSLIATYAIGSLPLLLIHASVAYADIFVATHVFLALTMLLHALRTDDGAAHKRLIGIGALSTALLIFTKNEALVLYLPPLLLAAGFTIHRTHRNPERLRMMAGYALTVGAVLLPWLLFKFTNDLSFANAKEASNMTIAWQPGVLHAVWINTFFEGNWLLLFPLLIFLLIKERRKAFSWPLIILSAYVLVVYFGQLLLFMFTELSVEALRQTGYARGVLQLVPCLGLLAALLTLGFVDKVRPQNH